MMKILLRREYVLGDDVCSSLYSLTNFTILDLLWIARGWLLQFNPRWLAVEWQESLVNRKKKEMERGKEPAGVFAFLLGFCSGLTFLAQTNPTSTIAPVYGPYSMATVPRSSIYVLLPFAGSSDLPVKEGKTTYLGLPATPSCSLLSCHKSCLAPRLKMSR